MRPITFLLLTVAFAPFNHVTAQEQAPAVTPFSRVSAQGLTVENAGAGLLALAGFGAGAFMGGIVGFLAEDTAQNPDSPCFDRSCTLLGAAVGGGAGALLLVGYWVIEGSAASNTLKAFMAGATGLGVGAASGAAIVVLGVSEGRACPNTDCVGLGAALGGFVGTVVGSVYGARRGRHAEKPSVVQHVLIGLGVGAGVGGFWGYMTDQASPISLATDDPCFQKSCSLLGAAIGGGYGALVGLMYWVVVTDQEPNAFLGGVAGLVVGSAIGFALGVR